MRERIQAELAMSFADIMYMAIEHEYRNGKHDLDEMMIRMKDLSAYSLTHAEILNQREGVELLALGMFFGMTSNPNLRYRNQARNSLLSEKAISYQGRPEIIEEEIAEQNKSPSPRKKNKPANPLQRRLL